MIRAGQVLNITQGINAFPTTKVKAGSVGTLRATGWGKRDRDPVPAIILTKINQYWIQFACYKIDGTAGLPRGMQAAVVHNRIAGTACRNQIIDGLSICSKPQPA